MDSQIELINELNKPKSSFFMFGLKTTFKNMFELDLFMERIDIKRVWIELNTNRFWAEYESILSSLNFIDIDHKLTSQAVICLSLVQKFNEFQKDVQARFVI